MDPLYFESSEESPKVILDSEKGVFELSGKSYPEDATQVYLPILDWIEQYAKNPNPTTNLVFRLEYFNTASQKLILDIFLALEAMNLKGKDVKVTWYYDHEDEAMKDSGEEFGLLVAVPFELVEEKEEETTS